MLPLAMRASASTSTKECPLICITFTEPDCPFTFSVYSPCPDCALPSTANTAAKASGTIHAWILRTFIAFLLHRETSRIAGGGWQCEFRGIRFRQLPILDRFPHSNKAILTNQFGSTSPHGQRNHLAQPPPAVILRSAPSADRRIST